jgi:iron complex outermembrane recepter protein
VERLAKLGPQVTRELGMAYAMFAIALPALAQAQQEPPDSPKEYRQFEKVEILGSAILQRESKASLPLRILTRQDISRRGLSSLDQAIHGLADQLNFQNHGQLASTILGGPNTAALHGLPHGTLVLLNGRRLPSYGLQTLWGERAAVDLGFVPLSAVERVEVIASGASSRYGSDALAGVINVVTRSERPQSQLSVETGNPHHPGGQSRQLDLAWGHGQFDRDGYNFQLNWQSAKQAAVSAGARPASAQAARRIVDGERELWVGAEYSSPYGAPANIVNGQGQIQPHPGQGPGICAPHFYSLPWSSGAECWNNPQRWLSLYPQTDRHQLLAQAQWAWNPQQAIWAEVQLTRQTLKYAFLPPALADIALPNDEGALFSADTLGPITSQNFNQSHRLSLGFKGQWHDWDYVLSASTGQHRVDRRLSSTGWLTDADFANLGLSKEELQTDPSQYSPDTRARLNSLWDGSLRWLETGWTRQQSLEWLASKEIFEGRHGPWMLGTGLNWRQESFAQRFVDPNWSPDMSGRRQVQAAHVELQVPLAETIEATASLRQDRYSDFGRANTGKVGAKWQITANWLLRASTGNGFRAPSLAQISDSEAFTGYAPDINGGNSFQVFARGNPQLQPEKSRLHQMGVQWQPSAQWILGADWWRLDVNNSFGLLSAQSIQENPEWRARYIRTQEDGSLRITQENLNLGRKQLQGIDWHWTSRHPLDQGILRSQIQVTQYLKARHQETPTGP